MQYSVMFIAKGYANIMSTDDSNSPILTLSAGSCLGITNLIWPRECGTEVKAASLCIVHKLKFTDFWRLVQRLCGKTKINRHVQAEAKVCIIVIKV